MCGEAIEAGTAGAGAAAPTAAGHGASSARELSVARTAGGTDVSPTVTAQHLLAASRGVPSAGSCLAAAFLGQQHEDRERPSTAQAYCAHADRSPNSTTSGNTAAVRAMRRRRRLTTTLYTFCEHLHSRVAALRCADR